MGNTSGTSLLSPIHPSTDLLKERSKTEIWSSTSEGSASRTSQEAELLKESSQAEPEKIG